VLAGLPRALQIATRRDRVVLAFFEHYDHHHRHSGIGLQRQITLQFFYGMHNLHSKWQLHRDVSYQNVLVKKYGNRAAQAGCGALLVSRA